MCSESALALNDDGLFIGIMSQYLITHIMVLIFQRLHAEWEKKYGEELEEELIYLFSVDKVLQIEDLKEVWVWFVRDSSKHYFSLNVVLIDVFLNLLKYFMV